jgi:glutamyl-tRNA reductase
MAILSLGVSHHLAPVELLERLAFTDEDIRRAYRSAREGDALLETVVLSTCNRVEVHAEARDEQAGFSAMKRLLCDSRGLDLGEIAGPLYSHCEGATAEHLFTVAAGLDSMVLGEPQILSQVREAHRRASAERAAGPRLTALFDAAVRTGRRVRAETAIGSAPDAFVAAATSLAELVLGELSGKQAVVVGAGRMAALCTRHLRACGVEDLRVLNRSREHARALAESYAAEHGNLAGLTSALVRADVIVSVTGSAGTVIGFDAVKEAMRRRDRPLFLLDLAVPRDVDPAVATIDGVHVLDIDDLREAVAERGRDISGDVERARVIVAEEVKRFNVRRSSELLAPLISALCERGDRVVETELAHFRTQLASLAPAQREAVETMARRIASKLLHQPMVRVKQLSEPGGENLHAQMLADLFGIELPSH